MLGEMSIIQFLIASPTMLVLAICSIITVGFAVERIMYFNSSRSDTRQFMNELGNRMKSGNPRQALDFCASSSSPVARVMAQGIMHMGRTRDELQQRLDTAIDLEVVEMERNLSVLGTMSNIAPLLGLFGTVIGFVWYYEGIRQIGPMRAALFINFVPVSAIALAYFILGLVWVLAIIGMTLKLFFWSTPGRFGPALYLIMGWLIVFDLPELLGKIPPH